MAALKASQIKRIALRSASAEETLAIGRILGKTAEEGAVIALTGDLGSGKTCLTQGIARGLGVPEAYAVTSPTFTLINEYPGRLVLYHFDVYRLTGAGDLEDMGYEDYFFGRGVAVIEWAEKIRDILPENTLYLEMSYCDENRRDLVLTGEASRLEKITTALRDGGF